MADSIDRQAAIDALRCCMDVFVTNQPTLIYREEVLTALRLVPSAQKWIPCSERLPEVHDEVLVTARGEVSIAWLYVDGKWRSNDMPQPMFRDIIAWMPLPEPYKGEQE